MLAARGRDALHARPAGRELQRGSQQPHRSGDRMADLLHDVGRLHGGIGERLGVVVHGRDPDALRDQTLDPLGRRARANHRLEQARHRLA